MGFPVISSTLQPFQMCIFNGNQSKLTFSNCPQVMRKGLWQICMHHWTVHGKVDFPKCPPDVTFAGYIPQLLIPTSEMNSIMFPMGGVHLTLVSKCALVYIYIDLPFHYM